MSIDIRITHIKNDPTGRDTTKKLNDEYVVVENFGDTKVTMYNWQLTDWRQGQQHIHKYNFKQYLSNGSTWIFVPGEVIFLFTGSGSDIFIPKTDTQSPQYHLYWNKEWFIWNNTGDTACLYNAEGKLVSQLTVP
jgi:hypothetical protein